MELIFLLLLVKHIIFDYFLQYSWMIKDKATYGASGGLWHSGLHGFGTVLVLVPFGAILAPFGAILAPFQQLVFCIMLGLIDSLFHYHIDWAKSNCWKKKKLTSNDQMFWILHGADQLAHILTYFLIVLMIKV